MICRLRCQRSQLSKVTEAAEEQNYKTVFGNENYKTVFGNENYKTVFGNENYKTVFENENSCDAKKPPSLNHSPGSATGAFLFLFFIRFRIRRQTPRRVARQCS